VAPAGTKVTFELRNHHRTCPISVKHLPQSRPNYATQDMVSLGRSAILGCSRQFWVDELRGMFRFRERITGRGFLRHGPTRPNLACCDLFRSARARRWPAGGWWVVRGSNPRHSRCKRDALPTELTTRRRGGNRPAGAAMQAADGERPRSLRSRGHVALEGARIRR
jgi:hypothetical protein